MKIHEEWNEKLIHVYHMYFETMIYASERTQKRLSSVYTGCIGTEITRVISLYLIQNEYV